MKPLDMKQTSTAQATTPITRRQAICSVGSSIGLLIVAVAVVIPLVYGGFPTSSLYKWIFAAGALVCLACTLFNPAPKSWPLSRRRWHRIEGWSSIFFCAAAVFLFVPGAAPRDWLAFTMAGAIIRIMAFIRSFRPYK